MLGFSGLTPATRSRADARTHLLEGELLVVGLDTSDVVRRGGIQGLHEQVQGGAELGKPKSRLVTRLSLTFCGRLIKKRPHTGGNRCYSYCF